MNKRYGAAMAGFCSLALLVAGCGDGDKAKPGTSLPTMTLSATIPAATPTPTPVDPTTAAKADVIVAYANYRKVLLKGILTGGVSYPYSKILTGGALEATNTFVTFHKGFRGTRFSGNSKLVSTMVTAIDLKAKPATASVRACIVDSVTGINKAGKRVITPAGKILKRDRMTLVKGRWLLDISNTTRAKAGECP